MAQVKKKKVYRTEESMAEDAFRHGGKRLALPAGEKVRKNVLRLCNHIQDLPGVIVHPGDPEYNALACCMSDDEVALCMKMKVRRKYSYDELRKKMSKWDEARFKKAVADAMYNGIIINDPEAPELPLKDGKKQPAYWIPIFVPGIMENMVDNIELVEKHPIIGRSFSEYTIKRLIPLVGNLPVGGSVMRVVPYENAIIKDPEARPSEKLSEIIAKADCITVAPCSCRASRRVIGEGCGHLEDDMCMQLNSSARAFIKTGRGRQITKEEALAILKKAEKNGLVHEQPNIEGDGNNNAICNCCGCSCFSLRVGEYFHTANMVRSNYISKIEPEKCVACGECVEACPMNALKLGERLKNKTPIKVKEPLNSYDHRWGPDRWNPDFRFNRELIMNETGTAPCKVACPAHIAVEGYLELAKEGRYEDALKLIKHKNPLPAVCGRICNKRCEDVCTRGKIDAPVSIDEVKKFIAQIDLDKEHRPLPEVAHPEYHDLHMAVIGSGPAGISAAYYLAEMGYSVTVFEKEEKLGGMLTLGIPSFRLEKGIVEAEIDVLRDMGVEFKTGVEVGKDVTIPELKEQGYKSIFVAIGAQGARKLGVEGEDLENIISGVNFLKDVNLGHAPKLHGTVIVMGGGNVAIDVARTAMRQGAERVELYCLEARDQMNAADDEVEEALEEGLILHNGWGVKEFVGKDGKLEKAVLKKCVSVFDENHRFSPKYDENEVVEAPCDFFLSAIGQDFVWGDLLKGTTCELKRNRLVADPLTLQTGDPDVFVGGDCYHGARFAIDAIATGKEAAESMHRHAHPGQSLIIGRAQMPYDGGAIDRDNIDIQGWDNTPRQKVRRMKEKDPMKDDRLVFDEAEAKKECGRCLKCGRTYVDETMCVGCGVCTTKCMFDAIHLERRFNAYGKTYEEVTMNAAPHLIARNLKIIFTGKGKNKFVNKDELDRNTRREGLK